MKAYEKQTVSTSTGENRKVVAVLLGGGNQRPFAFQMKEAVRMNEAGGSIIRRLVKVAAEQGHIAVQWTSVNLTAVATGEASGQVPELHPRRPVAFIHRCAYFL